MIERVSLFANKREAFVFIFVVVFVFLYSVLMEYNSYKILTRFDSQLVQARVLKQYTKQKNNKTFQVLKLKSDDGFTFYTSAKKSLENVKGKKVKLEIWAGKISFLEYLKGFYAYSKIKYIYKTKSYKQKLNEYISMQHKDKDMANIYQALFSATPLHVELQKSFSTLGVSHLLAISGFHLGVLSALLFLFLKPLYRFFQQRYFPYRSEKLDLFIVVLLMLLVYLVFLDKPPSLLRAFGMLFIGFVLYDRGVKIISMQTLFVTALLLIAFFPRLLFSLGFLLSFMGVYYIFLFLVHFKDLSKLKQFVLIPFWVYFLMLPFSLFIFSNFSLYHPLSIIWTSLFTLFYPLSIALHVASYGDMFDGVLRSFISLAEKPLHVELSVMLFSLHVGLSFLAMKSRVFVWALLALSAFIFVDAIYDVAQF
jgi:competence protein ComEC